MSSFSPLPYLHYLLHHLHHCIIFLFIFRTVLAFIIIVLISITAIIAFAKVFASIYMFFIFITLIFLFFSLPFFSSSSLSSYALGVCPNINQFSSFLLYSKSPLALVFINFFILLILINFSFFSSYVFLLLFFVTVFLQYNPSYTTTLSITLVWSYKRDGREGLDYFPGCTCLTCAPRNTRIGPS